MEKYRSDELLCQSLHADSSKNNRMIASSESGMSNSFLLILLPITRNDHYIKFQSILGCFLYLLFGDLIPNLL